MTASSKHRDCLLLTICWVPALISDSCQTANNQQTTSNNNIEHWACHGVDCEWEWEWEQGINNEHRAARATLNSSARSQPNPPHTVQSAHNNHSAQHPTHRPSTSYHLLLLLPTISELAEKHPTERVSPHLNESHTRATPTLQLASPKAAAHLPSTSVPPLTRRLAEQRVSTNARQSRTSPLYSALKQVCVSSRFRPSASPYNRTLIVQPTRAFLHYSPLRSHQSSCVVHFLLQRQRCLLAPLFHLPPAVMLVT